MDKEPDWNAFWDEATEALYQEIKRRLMLECSVVEKWTVEEFEAWKEKMVGK